MFNKQFLALAVFFLISALSLKGQIQYDAYAFEPDGHPSMDVFEDLDQDGDVDVLLVEGRTVWVFFCNNGAYPKQPDLKTRLPGEAVFLDVGEVRGKNIREFIYLTRKGVFRYSYSLETKTFESHPVVKHEVKLLPPRTRGLVNMDFLQRITGDDKEDLIIPELRRYLVFENKGDGSFDKWGEIPFKPKTDFFTESLSQTGRLKEIVRLPRLFSGRVKGKEMVILYDGTFVTHCEREPDGVFKVTDHRPLYGRDIREYEEATRAYFGKNIYFEDLDNNGTHALVIGHNKMGKVEFFKEMEQGKPFETEQSIRVAGWTLKPIFMDMNRDGFKDLILPCIEKISIFTIVRVFFSSQFDVQYMIFLNRKKPLFSLNPDYSRSVRLPLSFTAAAEGFSITHSMVFSFEGDFNGDGLHDLLVKSGPKTLGVYYGLKGGDFSKQPDLTLAYEPLAQCTSVATRVCDINLDGISDVYLRQSSIHSGKSRYGFLISKK